MQMTVVAKVTTVQQTLEAGIEVWKRKCQPSAQELSLQHVHVAAGTFC
jgi:hypothetical protein